MYVWSYPCWCGSVEHEVLEERLVQTPDGKLVDVLEGRGTGCGITQEFRFEHRHALEKWAPEVPSQLFDVFEWLRLLMRYLPRVSEAVGPENEAAVLMSLTAAEQALLFCNPGEEPLRADAFFHTPNPPEGLRLNREYLESIRQPLRERWARILES